MSCAVFIDGGHGTTGLEIRERLAGRADIALIEIDKERRRDANARRDAMDAADIALLCLPDDAARDAAAMAADLDTRIIDASSAHRTAPDWVYGFAELDSAQAARIAAADKVSNPGCYALAFIALAAPLVETGLIARDAALSVNATSGYSGGGKAMIAEFEQHERPTAFRNYALSLGHKHVPEMQMRAGLDRPPLFSPSVADTYRGMIVELPLADRQSGDAAAMRKALTAHYGGASTVKVIDKTEQDSVEMLSIERCASIDRLEVFIFENDDGSQIRLCALLDNLGKGAAGSAVQNLNLMMGLDERTGLRL